MKRKLLLFLLSALGFTTACDSEKNDEMVCMYGTPHINFRVQGKVTDKAGNPVPGIRVATPNTQKTVQTAQDGSYDITGGGNPGYAALFFTDTDGPANGGEFETKTVKVDFTEADRTERGDGDWNIGSYARRDVEVVLEEKQ